MADGIVQGMTTRKTKSPKAKPSIKAKPTTAKKPATALTTASPARAKKPALTTVSPATAEKPTTELTEAEAEAASSRLAIRERMQLPQGWTTSTLLDLAGLGEREPSRSAWLRPSSLVPRAREAVLRALAGWTPTRDERTRIEYFAVNSDEVDGGRINASDRGRSGARFALGRAISEARPALQRELEASRAFAALLAVADQEAMREEARRSGEDASVMPRPPKSLRQHLEALLEGRLSRLPLRDPVREFARRVRDGAWVRNTGDWDVIAGLEADVTGVMSAIMDTEVVSSAGRTVMAENVRVIEVSLDDSSGIWLDQRPTTDFKDHGKSRTSPLHQGMGPGALLVALADPKELVRGKFSKRTVEKLAAYLGKRVGVKLRRGPNGTFTYRDASGADVKFALVPWKKPT